MDPYVVATLACRAESTRLYGKPLQLVGDRSILARLIDQLERVDVIDEIVLAISDTPSQTSFIRFAEAHELAYVVGSEEDVLSRLIKAADAVGGDIVVRTTTENPFVYWENVDELVDRHVDADADLTETQDLPVGSFIEIVDLQALERSHREGENRHRSELCTTYIREHEDSFIIQRIDPPEKLRRPDIRLTVDYPADLILAREIHDRLKDESEPIRIEDVVDLVERDPALLMINAHRRETLST